MRNTRETFRRRLREFARLLRWGDPLYLPDGDIGTYIRAAEVLSGLTDEHLSYFPLDETSRLFIKFGKRYIIYYFLNQMKRPSPN